MGTPSAQKQTKEQKEIERLQLVALKENEAETQRLEAIEAEFKQSRSIGARSLLSGSFVGFPTGSSAVGRTPSAPVTPGAPPKPKARKSKTAAPFTDGGR